MINFNNDNSNKVIIRLLEKKLLYYLDNISKSKVKNKSRKI